MTKKLHVEYPHRKIKGVKYLQHRLIVEAVLGHSLPQGACIHHADGNRFNNEHSNLVVCPSSTYHSLLHARTKAWEACGNPNWRKCLYCKVWDTPYNLMSVHQRGSSYHRLCRNAYCLAWNHRRQANRKI